MNRVTRFGYLIIGVVGGMLAVWACGDDTLGGTGGGKTTGGGGTAHAQTNDSACKQWSIIGVDFDALEPETTIELEAGLEPFGVTDLNGGFVFTRKCIK